jgi:hypothetical protein
LDAGWHSVTIAAVDTTRLTDKGILGLTLEAGDVQHKQTVFLCNYNKEDYSKEFKSVFTALFESESSLYEQLLIDYQHEALHMLRGLKLDIEIQPGPGYTIERQADGYIAFDVISSKPLISPQQTVTTARKLVEARGHKRSYNRIANASPTHTEKNSESLRNAAEAITRAAETVYTHGAHRAGSGGDTPAG